MSSYIKSICNKVYTSLGPGYSERVYHNALEVLLRKNNIKYETEKIIPIVFEQHTIGNLRADLIVDDSIIVECKAIKSLSPQMKYQALNYIRLTGIPQAVMVNFPQCDSPGGCEFFDLPEPETDNTSEVTLEK